MKNMSVRNAFEAFQREDYVTALSLYNQLADLLGKANFEANIKLANSRLRKKAGENGAHMPLKAIKIACVMDEFTFHSYQPECDLMQLTPDYAITELEAFKPHMLFIESAWRGKDELWNRKISTLSSDLMSVLKWCRSRHVPTVFWNKEDPVHFETFLTTAQQFDYVFTTDIECIARYKAALGHGRVYLLPFACQPKTHNPIELYERKDAFCFAGAYYVRYPERTRDLENYVAELPKFKPLEIFDRNHGKDEVVYKDYIFPDEFRPYIVGTLPFNEIDKAYKGYRYAINLNSIKQSQSMFARRVYELLASNTVTISNFSRGLRLMFGDLVISTDSGSEIVNRLTRLSAENEHKLRLAALRKVMLEHTYQHRLAYVLSKALHRRIDTTLPPMLVVAMIESFDSYRFLIENFKRQSHSNKQLLLIATDDRTDHRDMAREENITFISSVQQASVKVAAMSQSGHWLAAMVPDDYYGPNYLLDLAIATNYSGTDLVGKRAHYGYADDTLKLVDSDHAYCPVQTLEKRSSAVRIAALSKEQWEHPDWLRDLANACWVLPGMSIDPFNYARNGQAFDRNALTLRVDDLALDTGVACGHIIELAENIAPAETRDTGIPRWSGTRLAELVKVTRDQINFKLVGDGLQIQSTLPDGKHEYLYAPDELPLTTLPGTLMLSTHLDATPGLNVQYVFVFLDIKKQKLSHTINTANRNHTTNVPEGTAYVRFGWRIMGNGTTTLKSLLWGHRLLEPARVIGKGEHLLLTNQYPSYDDLYRYGFVHTRVKAYAERGVKVDVFRFRKDQAVSFHEFQDVDCITGSQATLHRLLITGRYKTVLVHFLDPAMWQVLQCYRERLKVVAWIHGAEIQPWYRRDFNYESEQERQAARVQSNSRMGFWREVLHPVPPNLQLVFVSRYFAEEVMEDLGFRLPEATYTIIHNPIDTNLFRYQPKPPEQRKKILSIRPYASRQYANDLTVKAILHLSNKPYFKDLEFRLIGDGKLFDSVLEPLRKFSNVIIEKRFLLREEIAELHKEYGVFLCPTRWDSHGVSRDEAMASGLVPVTSAVAAIPEFVDESSGALSNAEDFLGLANSIDVIVNNIDIFQKLSSGAAHKVRRQASAPLIIKKELDTIYFNELQKIS
ncbi:MAG: glycosyltransferase [Rhodoferax sp.]|uniref:glycosyltransferase n=1 Tax=Rhodoferax sp. TaxID=50421 RepID=UPI002617DEF5|nr:glycosyltransferase [Rhodoferax sp.]MDD2882985.1 glycosyltransferase [Rhodoferax sp.]